jgi:hypothetical protein
MRFAGIDTRRGCDRQVKTAGSAGGDASVDLASGVGL